MGEFIRKRDYRFSGETITDDETTAMEKAIKVFRNGGVSASFLGIEVLANDFC